MNTITKKKHLSEHLYDYDAYDWKVFLYFLSGREPSSHLEIKNFKLMGRRSKKDADTLREYIILAPDEVINEIFLYIQDVRKLE